MTRNILPLLTVALMLLLTACSHPSLPDNATPTGKSPAIFPDYTDVTVPSNICPLNFMMTDDCDEVVAQLSVGDISYTYGEGKKVIMDDAEWQELRDAAKGKAITVEVYSKKGDVWKAYKPFAINVAEEEIDQYVSYRLIQPSYVAYEDLSIAQRDLTTFEQTDIYNNMMVATEKDGQCINCHSYKNYKTDNMLFHMRQGFGGTMLVSNGKVSKIDLKTDSTISAGVYPSWHPTKNLIAFSTNSTRQSFFTKDSAKIEVFDTESDLILYDIDKNEVRNICNAKDEFEVFPTWSPDGKTLYYCSAHFVYQNDSLTNEQEIMERYTELKYNIYARDFNENTLSFSEPRLIFDAAALGKSATLPRLSPDGKKMVFALGNYGCFHVWHADADIYMLDIVTLQATNLKAINSSLSESYPSFSSNGRWIMTASRRDDGSFTRPYISYYDKTGKVHKAFEIPQKDPEYNLLFLRSYNRPEFMIEPVQVSPQEFAKKAKEDAEKVTFAK